MQSRYVVRSMCTLSWSEDDSELVTC